MARRAAELIESSPMLELAMQPGLSVVVFRRLGWGAEDYKRWSTAQLERGLTLTVPTVLAEETLLRFCFLYSLVALLSSCRGLGNAAAMAAPSMNSPT